VLKLSDKAKAWRDTEGDREKLTKRLAELERQLEDAKTQLKVQHDHRGLSHRARRATVSERLQRYEGPQLLIPRKPSRCESV